jgi:predicted RNA-binding Zn-ribbon protein involved in translation (DUF1610 family)
VRVICSACDNELQGPVEQLLGYKCPKCGIGLLTTSGSGRVPTRMAWRT